MRHLTQRHEAAVIWHWMVGRMREPPLQQAGVELDVPALVGQPEPIAGWPAVLVKGMEATLCPAQERDTESLIGLREPFVRQVHSRAAQGRKMKTVRRDTGQSDRDGRGPLQ